jgi:hypothetical protein
MFDVEEPDFGEASIPQPIGNDTFVGENSIILIEET